MPYSRTHRLGTVVVVVAVVVLVVVPRAKQQSPQAQAKGQTAATEARRLELYAVHCISLPTSTSGTQADGVTDNLCTRSSRTMVALCGSAVMTSRNCVSSCTPNTFRLLRVAGMALQPAAGAMVRCVSLSLCACVCGVEACA